MRWIVVGAAGMLGQDMVAVARVAGYEVVALTRAELDVTDAAACRDALAGADVVVNGAAYTAVDAAEEHEADAFTVNAVGAANLARAAAAGARLVHPSTDYVFAGDADAPYAEDAPVAPRSAYGRTKAAGEWAVLAASPDHLVLRTAWLYGAGGGNFPKTIVRVARERGGVDVVDDQRGQPTWTHDVADLAVRLVAAEAPGGIYHATSSGDGTWFDFARAAVTSARLDPETVRPTTSEAFVRPAPRPAYSVLGHDALRHAGVEPIGDWRERWDAAAPSVLAK
ncbi:dTDP-4-dehydrorhamnose reductase [Luteimicrobium xylanilyticum]|uniref:dTDP-4-dehydrorhamnose reductase n=1 Tax=Luteimicrobium xylanilyticum TaxID=1133546 RepID=A0A5P9QDB7_9MICO|nr:dTDP-4-dehydrorhamnose reductase [Luteimicrobium xylanilyticum]QFU99100.1 dTDP-4-dehydrorhamnose reductase [Luteimicrobium xylanilyticum]